MRQSSQHLLSAFVIVAVIASGSTLGQPSSAVENACAPLEPNADDKRHPDFVRQIATASRFRDIVLLLDQYYADHKEYPTTLAPLSQYFARLPAEWQCDGWGRSIAFYSWGDRYVLLSFGRNGTAEPQVSKRPRVVLESVNYDTDLVMMDGKWIQSPRDVDI